MKTSIKFLLTFCLLTSFSGAFAQDQKEINTIFKGGDNMQSGGYGAVVNKFTMIDGNYANLVEFYGGWYINHKFLLGLGGAAVTNDLPVDYQNRVIPALDLSYMYGQFGLHTEYVVASEKTVHVVFQLFAGSGFTLQYQRNNWDEYPYDEQNPNHYDEQWFAVVEPGIQVELNLFKWMRFSPGISYRFTNGSDGLGLTDNDLSGASVNLGLKFGKF